MRGGRRRHTACTTGVLEAVGELPKKIETINEACWIGNGSGRNEGRTTWPCDMAVWVTRPRDTACPQAVYYIDLKHQTININQVHGHAVPNTGIGEANDSAHGRSTRPWNSTRRKVNPTARERVVCVTVKM
ncbi:hypothetical protein GOBAR_AA26996 [Gossypium barbadense]|uniref:Uncharacterized protein n=1 Tax=Gossypium barbadense TaxID=3634 RepID=A0A2P5WRG9_GOSBA|nr:hypothetical protein GOBAR_AA26996 [Gossypium barbadense]